MTIKQQGGIFGRNPTFNDVTIEGDLTTESGITTSGDIISSEQGITTPTADGITIERPTGTSSPTPVELRMSTTSSASDWSTSDPWGRVAFYNKDTSGGGGKIHASMEIRAAHSSGGRSRLAFKTTSSSADDLDNALVIDPDQGSGRHVTVSDGNLVIGTSGNGIDFSATAGTGTSELFDDYEEGEYTPTLTPAGSGSITLNSSYDKLAYTKIGRLVTVTGAIIVSSVSSPTGSRVDVSLPFTGGNTSDISERCCGLVLPKSLGSVNNAAIRVNGPSATVGSLVTVSSGTQSDIAATDFSGDEELQFTFSYIAS